MNTTLNYSPNFDTKKRKSKQIKFVIFHYTGMRREKDAIDKLTNKRSKVSCHYFIKNNGEKIVENAFQSEKINWDLILNDLKKSLKLTFA